VTASNREGSAAAFSNAAHVPGEKPELLEAPQVSTGLGTPPVEEATVGQRLTCAPGRWKGQPPPQFTYLWLSDGVSIPSATGSVYSAEPTDLNHVLSCIVTATNGEGSASAESSNDTVIRRKPVKNELPRELAIPPLEVAPPPTTVQIRTGLRVQLARAITSTLHRCARPGSSPSPSRRSRPARLKSSGIRRPLKATGVRSPGSRCCLRGPACASRAPARGP